MISTDKQFIDTWNEHKSATKVSKILGISLRNTAARRRKIEERHQITLSGRGVYPSKTQNKARHQLGVVDGVVIVFSDAHFWPGIKTTATKGLLWAIKEFKPVA